MPGGGTHWQPPRGGSDEHPVCVLIPASMQLPAGRLGDWSPAAPRPAVPPASPVGPSLTLTPPLLGQPHFKAPSRPEPREGQLRAPPVWAACLSWGHQPS